jgi:hypothetical protein
MAAMLGWLMNVVHLVECELAREKEVLGENWPRHNFCPPQIKQDLTCD